MTGTSKRELLEVVRPRYLRASKQEKTHILDEFVANTGYHRKSLCANIGETTLLRKLV
jgi:hypothetical protein